MACFSPIEDNPPTFKPIYCGFDRPYHPQDLVRFYCGIPRRIFQGI